MSKKKRNKVSNLKFDKIMSGITKESASIVFEVGEEKVEIKANPTISLSKRAQLIVDITDSVFVNGTYAPYMLNFACGYFKLKYYTDLHLPEDPEKVWSLLQLTDIEDQLDEIIRDTHIYVDALDLIEYRKAEFLKHNKADELLDYLISILENLDMAAEKGVGDLDMSAILNAVGNLQVKDDKALANTILDLQEEREKNKD